MTNTDQQIGELIAEVRNLRAEMTRMTGEMSKLQLQQARRSGVEKFVVTIISLVGGLAGAVSLDWFKP